MPEVALDDDLIEGLKGAKKSPRNFALIAKGVNPVKLLVQKKKFRDGELAKAKAEAKGTEVITGVLVASGSDFAFQILGEEPAVKPTKLKELIVEQTEITAKPRWEVVTALTEVSEEESEQGEQESQGKPTGQAQTAPVNGQAALSAWKAAREEAIAKLKEVGKEIAIANHPDSAPALIELKAVIANLTAEPSTAQQIAEVERYLDDDVVLDVCEFAHDIRTPLLEALLQLKQATVS